MSVSKIEIFSSLAVSGVCDVFLLKLSAFLFAIPERYFTLKLNCASSATHLVSVAPNFAVELM